MSDRIASETSRSSGRHGLQRMETISVKDIQFYEELNAPLILSRSGSIPLL